MKRTFKNESLYLKQGKVNQSKLDQFGTVIKIPPVPLKLGIGITGENVLEKRQIYLLSFMDLSGNMFHY